MSRGFHIYRIKFTEKMMHLFIYDEKEKRRKKVSVNKSMPINEIPEFINREVYK